MIVISKPVPNDPVPCMKEPVTEKVRFCCCINQGTISFGAQVDDTVLSKGEQARINMSVINDTRAAIKSVKASLMENVTWSAHGRRNKVSRVLANVDFGRFGGMDSKSKSQLNLKKSGGNYVQQNYDTIFQEIRSGSQNCVVRNPEVSELENFLGLPLPVSLCLIR